ncbi:MAG TPA: M23 family metallopeptidase [Bryobacteraceae bacterium]|nr:M23 family metallopeptidase [Bryobacteraceae bacterium]
MRLRNVLLALWVLLLVAGVAFYYGRHSAVAGKPAETRRELEARQHDYPAASAEPGSGKRADTLEATRTRIAEPDLRPLIQRNLTFPVAGVDRANVLDTFSQSRGDGRIHEATDIMADRGTRVVAVDDGVIAKLFLSKPGGITVYQFDPSEKYCYYYAHLDRYAEGLTEGMSVRHGQLIGYVGSTGNANPNSPHLHFAIFELGPEKKYWKGTPINPYPLLMRVLK